jgi:hypothetical protein
MGVELKGWFVLAKEGEPSFRYSASPAVCAPQDLLVVFPWTLDEVVSGSPKLMRPFIEEARYAAEHRNYYWSELRGVHGDAAAVIQAPHQAPYPNKSQKFNDSAAEDQGGNFGRVARGGLMTAWISELLEQPLSGIPAKHWQALLKIFAAGAKSAAVERGIARIRKASLDGGLSAEDADKIERLLQAARDVFEP